MDQATILKILENNGAPPTQENINRVMQQSGRGTELLGRSMGLQGGNDESGPGMDLMLDKVMKSTARAAPAPIADEGAAVSDAPSRSPVVAAPSSASCSALILLKRSRSRSLISRFIVLFNKPRRSLDK